MKSILIYVFVIGFMSLNISDIKAQQQDQSIVEEEKHEETMPRFPGCEHLDLTDDEKKSCADRLMLTHIYKQINYPKKARNKGKQGQVIVGFLIDRDGSLSDFTIFKDIGYGIGEEALRVAKTLGDKGLWFPGIRDGKTVEVEYKVPITFKLQ